MPTSEHILLRRDGSVALPALLPSANFGFHCFEREFLATTRAGSGGIELELSARLATLPYTVEGSWRRRSALAIIAAARDGRPFCLAVSRRQQIYFLAGQALAAPTGSADILCAVVRLLLEAKPFIEALAQCLPDWSQGTRVMANRTQAIDRRYRFKHQTA